MEEKIKCPHCDSTNIESGEKLYRQRFGNYGEPVKGGLECLDCGTLFLNIDPLTQIINIISEEQLKKQRDCAK